MHEEQDRIRPIIFLDTFKLFHTPKPYELRLFDDLSISRSISI